MHLPFDEISERRLRGIFIFSFCKARSAKMQIRRTIISSRRRACSEKFTGATTVKYFNWENNLRSGERAGRAAGRRDATPSSRDNRTSSSLCNSGEKFNFFLLVIARYCAPTRKHDTQPPRLQWKNSNHLAKERRGRVQRATTKRPWRDRFLRAGVLKNT